MQALANSRVAPEFRIQIGAKSTRGLGAGGDPDVGLVIYFQHPHFNHTVCLSSCTGDALMLAFVCRELQRKAKRSWRTPFAEPT